MNATTMHELMKGPPLPAAIDIPLSAIHHQCERWLQVIGLWRFEVGFFNELLSERLFGNLADAEQNVIAGAIQGISGTEIDEVEKEVRRLGRMALTVMAGNDGSVVAVRESFREVRKRVNVADKRLRSLRSLVMTTGKIVNQHFFYGNETLDTIRERRSVRKYLSNAVDPLHIHQVLEAGCMAPSAMNNQPWKFYVLTDPVKIRLHSAAIMEIVNKKWPGTAGGDAVKDPVFYEAPVVIYITGPADNEWAPVDTGLCAQNIMLAARSMGYDTCPVGLGTLLAGTEAYAALGIGASEKIILAIAMGEGAETREMPERRGGNIRFVI